VTIAPTGDAPVNPNYVLLCSLPSQVKMLAEKYGPILTVFNVNPLDVDYNPTDKMDQALCI